MTFPSKYSIPINVPRKPAQAFCKTNNNCHLTSYTKGDDKIDLRNPCFSTIGYIESGFQYGGNYTVYGLGVDTDVYEDRIELTNRRDKRDYTNNCTIQNIADTLHITFYLLIPPKNTNVNARMSSNFRSFNFLSSQSIEEELYTRKEIPHKIFYNIENGEIIGVTNAYIGNVRFESI